ncbi:type II toxin-antitoxin system RelE/ParE family toxin [Methylomonas sp. MED-D]|uniref:type II toxin-antitoxin system RelE/ParE family toxin n=1 Tax=unclassified Methylomonas TaxID=2608980 RepID=UPI0028A4C94C|nr:type II toxin-antitoxin system RelE/ParE family toxin [Methylomonas sp. MV1]MDT4332796.1 type II toxin-antitoxin system RelE/ParE family toxin [Methylomonas sp. MV1]
MSLRVTFHRAASAEFIEASAWYEAKRIGLALEFMAEIERCVSLASKQPLQFAIVRADIRRVVANRFPYNVYFRAEDHRIVVLAVFHCSRDPAIWHARA